MTNHTALGQELPSFDQVQQYPLSNAMKTYNIYYTTSRLNAKLHLDTASGPCNYYAESKLLTTRPSLLLRAGDSKSAPLVASAKLAYLDRNILLGCSSDSQSNNSPVDLTWEVMRRKNMRLVRSDYEFETSIGASMPGKRTRYRWQVTNEKLEHYFKTLYRCFDDQGRVVASMRSGGMANLRKGGEIDIAQGLESVLEDLLVVSALGIWAAEAGWSGKTSPAQYLCSSRLGAPRQCRRAPMLPPKGQN